jgi:hypothetical protein
MTFIVKTEEYGMMILTNGWGQIVINNDIVSNGANIRIPPSCVVPDTAVCPDVLVVSTGIGWV